MTERKTGGRLTIFQRIDPGNVPAPWLPPELPAAKDAPGLDLSNVPAPWVPPELPAAKDAPGLGNVPAPWVPAEMPATAVPVLKSDDRKLATLKPWVPPELPAAKDAPRNLPATVADHHLPATVPDDETPAPKKRKKKRDKERQGELAVTAATGQAGQPISINIVNQVAAPAPVYYGPWWGGWGGCPHAYCARRAGRTCWRLWCWWS